MSCKFFMYLPAVFGMYGVVPFGMANIACTESSGIVKDCYAGGSSSSCSGESRSGRGISETECCSDQYDGFFFTCPGQENCQVCPSRASTSIRIDSGSQDMTDSNNVTLTCQCEQAFASRSIDGNNADFTITLKNKSSQLDRQDFSLATLDGGVACTEKSISISIDPAKCPQSEFRCEVEIREDVFDRGSIRSETITITDLYSLILGGSITDEPTVLTSTYFAAGEDVDIFCPSMGHDRHVKWTTDINGENQELSACRVPANYRFRSDRLTLLNVTESHEWSYTLLH